MPTKIITLKEAVEFIRDNGYLLSVYKKQGDNYMLYDECYTVDMVDLDTLIEVKTAGAATDFNEFTTEDKEYCFRLHNNFNIPLSIPIIKRD